MQQKRKGTPLIVCGIILVVVGVGLLIGGNIVSGDMEANFSHILDTGRKNPAGGIMTGIGIGCLIVGGILAVLGIVMYVVSGKTTGINSSGQTFSAPAVKFNGIFSNPAKTYSVELNGNGTCVWTQSGKRYKGRYGMTDSNEWTIYIDGYGEAFKFSARNNGIHVTGGPVDELFFSEVR